MITSVQALAAAARFSFLRHQPHHHPAQWKACWNACSPTTGAANACAFAGHNIAPYALIAGIIIGILLLVSRSSSRSPATSR